MLAAFLKLLMPFIVVIPGVSAYLLAQDPLSGVRVARPDAAYPALVALAPEGVRGLIVAGLVAAIVSSLGSMMNSISTIFTLDIYRHWRSDQGEATLVRVGRLVSFAAIVIALVSARPLLGNFEQAFQYIQEFTGFATPGVCTLFLLGMFWKRATASGAIAAVFGTLVFSVVFRFLAPEIPFMDRVGYVFLLCCAAMVVVSLVSEPTPRKGVDLSDVSFTTSNAYNTGSCVVILILIGLYLVWW